MPNMVSLRSFRLASLCGFVTFVEAKVPFLCPDTAVAQAMKEGCVPESEADIPFHDDKTPVKRDFHGDLRKSMLHLAIASIMREGNVKDFNAGGIPKVEVVSDRLGVEVGLKELQATYREYTGLKAKGEEYAVLPEASNLMRVIDATTSAELLKIAEEFGEDPKKYDGLTQRGLRRALLGRFAGVAVV